MRAHSFLCIHTLSLWLQISLALCRCVYRWQRGHCKSKCRSIVQHTRVFRFAAHLWFHECAAEFNDTCSCSDLFAAYTHTCIEKVSHTSVPQKASTHSSCVLALCGTLVCACSFVYIHTLSLFLQISLSFSLCVHRYIGGKGVIARASVECRGRRESADSHFIKVFSFIGLFRKRDL